MCEAALNAYNCGYTFQGRIYSLDCNGLNMLIFDIILPTKPSKYQYCQKKLDQGVFMMPQGCNKHLDKMVATIPLSEVDFWQMNFSHFLIWGFLTEIGFPNRIICTVQIENIEKALVCTLSAWVAFFQNIFTSIISMSSGFFNQPSESIWIP